MCVCVCHIVVEYLLYMRHVVGTSMTMRELTLPIFVRFAHYDTDNSAQQETLQVGIKLHYESNSTLRLFLNFKEISIFRTANSIM